jgi:hypothetical protein
MIAGNTFGNNRADNSGGAFYLSSDSGGFSFTSSSGSSLTYQTVCMSCHNDEYRPEPVVQFSFIRLKDKFSV